MALMLVPASSVLSQSVQSEGGAEQAGESLLGRYCARCHAIGTSGESPHRTAPPFRNISKNYPVEHLEEALAEGIFTGHPDMPVFSFEADEVGEIIAYLKSIQTR